MKNKFILSNFIIIIIFLLTQSNVAYASEQTPEILVSDFYNWYIEALHKQNVHKKAISPEKDDMIYNYVDRCTVNRYRLDLKKGAIDHDYFLKSNDFEYEYFKKIYRVHKAVKIDDSLSIVPVGYENPYVIVVVQKTKDGWRIIKVEDRFQDY